MIKLKNILFEYFVSINTETEISKYFSVFILLLAFLIILWIMRLAFRSILLFLYTHTKKTKTQLDDILMINRVPRNLATIVPFLIAYYYVPIIFEDFIPEKGITEKGIEVIGVFLLLVIFQSIFNSLRDYLETLKNFNDKPIKSYAQVISIFIWSIGILSALGSVTGVSFVSFITTLGATSAVLLLIFKDSILGFVASIQVSLNDMVRIGDWITFDKFGADGDVIEINLITVKVQNFDMTITTIPTYSLVSDSFKNWRAMQNSGGRRIKRSIFIKQKSVKFLTSEDIEQLKNIHLIHNYLNDKQAEINQFNTSNQIDKNVLLNGRNLTNIGVFRKYTDEYLNKHSAINKEMMLMVRQLQPTPNGIPIEIYAFSKDKRFENYEYIMADIFDHIIPAVKQFDLELFEFPSGNDFKSLTFK